jgi:hypothetical protein
VLRHRVVLNYQAASVGVVAGRVVGGIIASVRESDG